MKRVLFAVALAIMIPAIYLLIPDPKLVPSQPPAAARPSGEQAAPAREAVFAEMARLAEEKHLEYIIRCPVKEDPYCSAELWDEHGGGTSVWMRGPEAAASELLRQMREVRP